MNKNEDRSYAMHIQIIIKDLKKHCWSKYYVGQNDDTSIYLVCVPVCVFTMLQIRRCETADGYV